MSFSNSNLVHFFNTVNLSKTKELTKINAEASILTGKLVGEVLRENYKQTELSKKNLYVAMRNNQALEEMNSNLIDIGKGINTLNRNVSKLTDTMKEGFAELTNAQKEQTKIHKEHYDKIEKEKALKEILYNMKKYFSALKEMNDPISKAYSAKVLLKMLEEGNLKIKDLSEIKDKEYYDEQISEANKIIGSLTEQESIRLENFETLYSSYDVFMNVQVEDQFPKPKNLIRLKAIDHRKFPKQNISKPDERDYYNKDNFKELEEKINENKKKQKTINLIIIGDIIFFIFHSLLLIKVDFGKDHPIYQFSPLFLIYITLLPVLVGWKIFLFSGNKKDKLKIEELKNLYEQNVQRKKKHEEEKYLQDLKENEEIEKQIENEKAQLKSQNEKIEKENSEILNFNNDLELKIKQAKEAKKEFINNLQNELNSFLEEHPKIQDFLPKVDSKHENRAKAVDQSEDEVMW